MAYDFRTGCDITAHFMDVEEMIQEMVWDPTNEDETIGKMKEVLKKDLDRKGLLPVYHAVKKRYTK